MQKATFGAGCFWSVEEAFRQVNGVESTRVGYLGGNSENPSYSDVCTGRTGHAEVVEVEYDSSILTYEKLLKVFWENHDPTQHTPQVSGVGTQYRSAIFFHTPEQKAAAIDSKQALERDGKYQTSIATEIMPAAKFYKAEEYHQRYLAKRALAQSHV